MLDAAQSPELQAALLSVRQAERDIRLDINATARKELKPIWQESLKGHAETRLELRALVPGARIAVGARNITAHAATSRRPLRGGLIPAVNYAPIEWGSNRHNQFRSRTKNGRVVMPAAAMVITKAVAIWVVTIVDKFRSFAEVKP